MNDNIPLILGRQSTGEVAMANLATLPNLFISHSNEGQLPAMFSSLMKSMYTMNAGLQFALSLGSRMATLVQPLLPTQNIALQFLHAGDDLASIRSTDEFMAAVLQEFKRRKAMSKLARQSTTSCPPMVVFMDDIFEVIMSPNKKTSLSFIELLITGATANIYFIMGSAGIYRNMLNQIIHVTPALQQKLKKSVQAVGMQHPLGAELVMNPDGLLFYRERDEKVHRRLYPNGVKNLPMNAEPSDDD